LNNEELEQKCREYGLGTDGAEVRMRRSVAAEKEKEGEKSEEEELPRV